MIDDLAGSPDPYAEYRALRRPVLRLPDGRWLVADPAAAAAVLADETAIVPPPDDPVRAAMARFSEGDDHRRRRAIAVEALAGLDPAWLRARTRQRAHGAMTADRGIDLVEVARRVPVAVLAEALGCSEPGAAADATRRLAAGLAPPRGAAPGDPRPALADLHRLLAVGPDETRTNLAALLFQAWDATAGLVGNTLVGGTRAPADDALARTLDRDPPVHHTVRTASAPLTVADRAVTAGDTLVVLLAAAAPTAGGLAFGAGRHRCPGASAAIALAAGVLDAVPAGRVRHGGGYEARANLRIPAGLELVA